MHYYYGLNRTLCDVLREIRDLNETKNYSSLISLVEEIQSMANRMESALADYKDYSAMIEHKAKLKLEIKKLKTENKALKKLKGLEDENELD
jgi:hypothetical protein